MKQLPASFKLLMTKTTKNTNMKSTLKIRPQFYTNRGWIFNQRFHVTNENNLYTHEMSINFNHPELYQPRMNEVFANSMWPLKINLYT